VDLAKLGRWSTRWARTAIPYVSVATAVNMAGGQPVSMANLRALRELCPHHGIPIVHDMTRVAENAYFIKQREAATGGARCRHRAGDLLLTDGCTMSSKKDAW
jgi:tyrosine phenol-lyase